ncbi:class I fructose-bisphosphate aldolase [Heyndrickxia ginsengihumi]|nr:hypothetical protein [Heyndrickxia ginsengihumi]
MSRIFSDDGKSIILALDGYSFSAETSGIDKTIGMLSELVENGVDAVIVSYGTAKIYCDVLANVPMLVRADLSTSLFDASVPGTTKLLSVEDALKMGADGIVSMTFPGGENEANSHRIAWEIAKAADDWNMPFMCETLPYGYHVTSKQSNQIEKIAAGARLGTELGADMIKTRFTGEQGDAEIIKAAKCPVFALGGPKAENIFAYFTFVKHCIDVGAKGVAIGRNITQSPNPIGMAAGLNTIIHKNGTAEEAFKVYEAHFQHAN